jgi:hypothetical protein
VAVWQGTLDRYLRDDLPDAGALPPGGRHRRLRPGLQGPNLTVGFGLSF